MANGDNQRMDDPNAFEALQATFSSTRRARPPMLDISTGDIASRVPLREPKVKRRDSKGGLRAMFTRNRSEKSVISPVAEEPAPLSAFSERSLRAVAEATLPRSMSMKRAKTFTSDSIPPTPATPVTPARPTSKASRLNLRSKSVKHTKTPSKPSPISTKSSTKSPRPPTRTSTAWDPPPLFQAYPQAIKHAQLSASALSADAILRISNHKRNSSIRDELAQTMDPPDQTAAGRKTDKSKSKHRRQISGSISKSDWTQKIFVLVTSGYLLQYSGEGSFDRLPEKMMQLGKDSVAFASDVIPGKHWVLQISQAMDADGTPAADSRSLLSRLAFRGADYRRTATSLLLVLNSAEEMDSWIAVVRREIEALGGKKHVSETGKPKPDDKVMQLRAQPSHRYLVHRDPDQFSNPASPQVPSFGPPPWVKEKDNELQQRLEDAASAMIQPPPTTIIRPSTGGHSIANSTTSHDGQQLDNLRDSTNRFSYVSSGQRTLITSQGSSPATSPTRDTAPSFDESLPKVSTDDIRLRPNAAAINERRRSMQTIQIPVLESQPPAKNFRHSTYGGPARPVRSHSLGTPNFSVPNSSSKRFSTSRNLNNNAPRPSSTSTSPHRPRDSNLKGIRKQPPAALNISRSLSPVKDSTSPKYHKPLIFTPTESSFKIVPQSRPSVVNIPPRSPGGITAPIPDADLSRPQRRSSLMPLASPEMAYIDFQFPRRLSSMQTLRADSENLLDPPFRAAPSPPSNPHPHFSRPTSAAGEARPLSRDVPSPLPALANMKTKMKRPISMQVRTGVNGQGPSYVCSTAVSSPNPTPNSGRPFSITSSTSTVTPLSPPFSILSPSLQRVLEQSNPKTLANRRSMPTLVNGPPPAPPPDCALPPLPPGSAGMRSPATVRSSIGSRGSMTSRSSMRAI